MIKDLNQLSTLPALIILYPEGSSGEFLAHALTESLATITETHQHWENENRCKYFDLFDRTLTSSTRILFEDAVLAGINSYLEKNNPNGHLSIGLVHPAYNCIKFLEKYAKDTPTIEIVTHKPQSKQFRYTAAYNKIGGPGFDSSYYLNYDDSGYTANNHLKLEWSDIFLDSTELALENIKKFVRRTGSVDQFKNMVANYLHRNSEIVEQI